MFKCKFLVELMEMLSNEEIKEFESTKKLPIKSLAEKVCIKGEPKLIYRFAQYIPDAPIDMLTDAICKSGNGEYIYAFAINIKGASKDKLVDGICKTGDLSAICLFNDYNISGLTYVNKEKIIQAIIDGEDPKYMAQMINYIKIPEFIDRMTEAICKTKSCKYIIEFAKKVYKDTAEDPIEKLAKTICDVGDPYWIYQFYISIEAWFRNDSITERLIEAICKTGDAEWIDLFYNHSHDKKEKLAEAILKTGEAKNIYALAFDGVIRDDKVFEEALIKAGDIYYLYNYSIHIGRERVLKSLKNTNEELYEKMKLCYEIMDIYD